jgi:DNA-binding transcriptional LysR family regulator
MDWRSVDLNLLACLDALVQTRSVTKAAVVMEMSQPGMSKALTRLRQLFDDPLLVRTNQGMVATPRGLELREQVRAGLAHIRGALDDREEFDPARSSDTFTIAGTDWVGTLVVPSLMERLAQLAPAVRVNIVPPDAPRLREQLEEGLCDLSVGFFVEMADGLYATQLAKDDMACIARKPHPLIDGRVSLATYAECRHVYLGAAPVFNSTLEMMTDRALKSLGVHRHIGFATSNSVVLPEVVAVTDMLATIPRRFALRYAHRLPLQVLGLPFPAYDYSVSMVWHERSQRAGAHRWFRQQVREAAGGI